MAELNLVCLFLYRRNVHISVIKCQFGCFPEVLRQIAFPWSGVGNLAAPGMDFRHHATHFAAVPQRHRNTKVTDA